jgi:hypothetical protein
LSEFVAAGQYRVTRGRIGDFLATLASQLGLMATELQRVAIWPQLQDLGATIVRFADTLQAVVQPFRDALGFWGKLSDFIGENLQADWTGAQFEELMTALADDLGIMATQLRRVMDDPLLKGIDQPLRAFAQMIGVVADELTKALGFLTALRAWKETADLTERFERFGRQWQSILERLDQVRKDTQTFVSDDLRKYMAAVGEIADGLRKAVDLLTAAEAVRGANDVEDTMTRVADLLEQAMTTFSERLDQWDREALNAARDFGQAVGGLLDGLKAGLDLIAATPETWPPMTTATWNAFFGWVQTAFDAFYDWLEVGDFTKEGDDLVAAFGSALSSLMGSLAAAAQFMLGEWAPPESLRWGQFLVWVSGTFSGFYYWLNETWTTEQINLVGAFGSALSSLMGGLAAAAQFQLGEWAPPEPLAWGQFLVWVSGTFSSFYAWIANQFETEKLALVSAFGSALSGLMGGLAAAAQFSMGGWTPPAGNLWGNFLTWMSGTFSVFYAWINDQFEAEKLNLVGTFGQALGGLMGGLMAAAQFTIGEWSAPEPVTWGKFLAWMSGTFSGFYAWVGDQFETERLALVGTFGQALSGLMAGLTAAAQFGIGEWQAPSPITWGAFLAWVGDTFAAFYAWVDGQFATEVLSLVGAFGQALSSLMGGLSAALTTAGQVPESWEVDATVWNAFIAWTTETMNALIQMITERYPQTAEEADAFAPVAAWGQALGAVMGGLQAALQTAANFQFTEPNGNTWAAFEGWVEEVMYRLTAWVQATYPEGGDFEPVSSFGQAMNAVFGGLGAALDVFKGLQGYIPILESRITNFVGSVTYAYGLVQAYATGAGVEAGTAATTAFANAANAVFQALGSALQVFGQLTEGTDSSVEVFKRQMADLIERINGTLGAWQTYVVDSLGATWLPAAEAFNSAVSQVLDVLKKALDLFVALDEHGLPSMAQLQDLIDYTLALFAEFSAGLLASMLGVQDAAGGIGDAVGGLPSELPPDSEMHSWGYNIGWQMAAGMDEYAATQMDARIYAFASNVSFYLNNYLGEASAAYSAMVLIGQALGDKILASLGYGMEPETADPYTLATLQTNLTNLGNWLDATAQDPAYGAIWSHGANLANVLLTHLGSGLNPATANTYYLGQIQTAALNLTNWIDYNAFQMYGQLMMHAGLLAGVILTGLAYGLDPATANSSYLSGLQNAINALVDWIEAKVMDALGAGSPSERLADLAVATIPTGLAQGMLAGVPLVGEAAARLAEAAVPDTSGLFAGAFGAGEWDVSGERRIVVEFRGQAGGGVPLTPQQFSSLKKELAYAIRIGA